MTGAQFAGAAIALACSGSSRHKKRTGTAPVRHVPIGLQSLLSLAGARQSNDRLTIYTTGYAAGARARPLVRNPAPRHFDERTEDEEGTCARSRAVVWRTPGGCGRA